MIIHVFTNLFSYFFILLSIPGKSHLFCLDNLRNPLNKLMESKCTEKYNSQKLKPYLHFSKIGNHLSSHLNISLFCFVYHGGIPGGLYFTHIRHLLAYFSSYSWLGSSIMGDRSFFIYGVLWNAEAM